MLSAFATTVAQWDVHSAKASDSSHEQCERDQAVVSSGPHRNQGGAPVDMGAVLSRAFSRLQSDAVRIERAAGRLQLLRAVLAHERTQVRYALKALKCTVLLEAQRI